MRTNQSVSVASAIVIGMIALNFPSTSYAQKWDDLEKALEGRELIMRPTMEGRRKVYLEVGESEVFALHRGNRLFPLRATEPVRIVDVDPERGHVEIELESSRLGRGRVDFYGSPPSASDFELWLDEIFEVITADAEFNPYVGNRESSTLHIRGANHLPEEISRVPFLGVEDALAVGYHRCGVCFVPTPDVSGYETERDLAMFSLQQVRSTYYLQVDIEDQERIASIGNRVLDNWPVPLKGYRYQFQVVDTDQINAFAVPTGYIFVTRGLLESLETDDEVEAILAHEIAHVESRHSYRLFRNQRNVSRWSGFAAALAGATDNEVDDVVTLMASLASNIFMAGHGRDREREADTYASFYLSHVGIGDAPLVTAFKKLKFSHDAYDPFGNGGGLFSTHPDISERLNRATFTATEVFPEGAVFNGLNKSGSLVATLRFDVQRLFGRELDVIATLSTTAELGEADNVNTLNVRVNGQRLELKERTAERVFPSDEVSAVFGNDSVTALIQTPVESVNLKLRNVDRWERAQLASAQTANQQ